MDIEDVDVALDYVATSEHGQKVRLFARDPCAIGRIADSLVSQVFRVNLNCQCQRGTGVFPFAGTRETVEGTLSVTDTLRSFSIRSNGSGEIHAPRIEKV